MITYSACKVNTHTKCTYHQLSTIDYQLYVFLVFIPFSFAETKTDIRLKLVRQKVKEEEGL